MTDSPHPEFSTLSPERAEALLRRARIGRLAYVTHDRVDVEPIHFVYDDGWIYARTAPGTKLSTLVRRPWVALQADEVRGDFDWESVVAKGTVYFVEDDDTPRGAELRDNVIALLRRVIPASFTPDDPTPDRDILLRIHVDEVHGRAAVSR